MIVGNIIGGVPSAPKTVTFLTNSGQEIQAVLVNSEKIFTAEANDVREGKTFASDYGVMTGNTVIIEYKRIYARIDSATGLCLGVFAGTVGINDVNFIEIPVYDKEYAFKYYINNTWYEDADGTIPWTSSLIEGVDK